MGLQLIAFCQTNVGNEFCFGSLQHLSTNHSTNKFFRSVFASKNLVERCFFKTRAITAKFFVHFTPATISAGLPIPNEAWYVKLLGKMMLKGEVLHLI